MNELPKISSHLPDITDRYIKIREERLLADKTAAKLKEQEEELKHTIIAKLREEGMTAVGGAAGTVKMKKTVQPVAEDWVKVWAYIHEHNAFELLHKRLTQEAVEERWGNNVEIPGVGRTDVYKLSVSK